MIKCTAGDPLKPIDPSTVELDETLPQVPARYYDETLLYCLDGGAALLDRPATADGPP